MKIIFILFWFLTFHSLAKNFTTNPARAVWLEKNELQLLLTNNVGINDQAFYYLRNENQNIEIKLDLKWSFNNKLILIIPQIQQATLKKFIKGPAKVVVKNFQNEIVEESNIQLAKLIDEIASYDGNDLGVSFISNSIQLKLWAPTALNVKVLLFKDSSNKTPEKEIDLVEDGINVWKINLPKSYEDYFYQYKIQNYYPEKNQIQEFVITDPYSVTLSTNSEKSQLVNVYAEDLKPQGWDQLKKPNSKVKTIYEAHIRDLTVQDTKLNDSLKGKYLGLVDKTSDVYAHLKSLAQDGLSHIHLLPINDFATVNEDEFVQEKVDPNLSLEHGASQNAQNEINRIRHVDAYNWGYDPYHYFAPEGSYSVNPNGKSRILELRKMVSGLNRAGLKVIVDVVFNHTYSAGVDRLSNLNKIVPLYYYRLDDAGNVKNSSCCSDTASENKMFEKLMKDAVVYWAKVYKIDGFRFDLMSFHTKDNLKNVKKELLKLDKTNDGVDGSQIYLYGEGWSFGSMVEKNSSIAMTQLNGFGEGIGFFNDRFRDAIRGGTTDSHEKSDQGFATGLYFDFNKEIANRNTPEDLNEQKLKLQVLTDVIKIGLAGNLRDFKFNNFLGHRVSGGNYYFKGAPVAYAYSPLETVNYVSAHDGYSLFDAISAKAPFYTEGRYPSLASLEDKQRMVQLSLALTLFSQGVAFIESGSEILRSKSGDTDSYDSGDWFNQIYYNFEENNWAKGLPPSFKNYNDWSFWYPRLKDLNTLPTRTNILTNLNAFKAFLKVRSSSSLFQLNSLDEVEKHLSFLSNANNSNEGVIALNLKNADEELIILFNTRVKMMKFYNQAIDESFILHRYFNSTHDSKLKIVKIGEGEITLPARSVVIIEKAK